MTIPTCTPNQTEPTALGKTDEDAVPVHSHHRHHPSVFHGIGHFSSHDAGAGIDGKAFLPAVFHATTERPTTTASSTPFKALYGNAPWWASLGKEDQQQPLSFANLLSDDNMDQSTSTIRTDVDECDQCCRRNCLFLRRCRGLVCVSSCRGCGGTTGSRLLSFIKNNNSGNAITASPPLCSDSAYSAAANADTFITEQQRRRPSSFLGSCCCCLGLILCLIGSTICLVISWKNKIGGFSRSDPYDEGGNGVLLLDDDDINVDSSGAAGRRRYDDEQGLLHHVVGRAAAAAAFFVAAVAAMCTGTGLMTMTSSQRNHHYRYRSFYDPIPEQQDDFHHHHHHHMPDRKDDDDDDDDDDLEHTMYRSGRGERSKAARGGLTEIYHKQHHTPDSEDERRREGTTTPLAGQGRKWTVSAHSQ